MRNKNLNRQIFHLAIPNIISNLSVPLLSSVDTALVGHLPSPVYIGAVAIGSMIFNFVYWGFGFLRMGTTGLTAQAFGQDNQKEMNLLFWRSLLFATGAGILLILSQKLIAWIGFTLVDASPQVEHNASVYFSIRIFAAPATLSLYAIHGWFLGMQNARFPLIITVAVNLLNILFNVFFVMGLHKNSDGVAYGTVLSQYLGVALSLYFLFRYYRKYIRMPVLKEILAVNPLVRFVKVNFDIFIRTLSLIFAFSFFTAQSAKLGDVTLAANSILIQLWMIFSYGIDGFAFSAESLVGKYTGAHQKRMLLMIIQRIFLFGAGLGLFFTVVYFLFRHSLPALFTGNINVLAVINLFMIWTIVAPFINSFCYIWDGIYIGATATKALRNAMLLATFGIYLPMHYFLEPRFGNHGMWAALILFMITRGVSLSVLSNKYLGISFFHLLKWESREDAQIRT